MKLCKVSHTTVVIPVIPEIRWWDTQFLNSSADVGIQKRYVYLTPRELDGQQVMAAYDRETDTLFIKE